MFRSVKDVLRLRTSTSLLPYMPRLALASCAGTISNFHHRFCRHALTATVTVALIVTPSGALFCHMQLLGRTTRLKEQFVKDKEVSERRLISRKRREDTLTKLLIREGVRAQTADENAKEYIAGFRVSITHDEGSEFYRLQDLASH